jgi:hypothetical protein
VLSKPHFVGTVVIALHNLLHSVQRHYGMLSIPLTTTKYIKEPMTNIIDNYFINGLIFKHIFQMSLSIFLKKLGLSLSLFAN